MNKFRESYPVKFGVARRVQDESQSWNSRKAERKWRNPESNNSEVEPPSAAEEVPRGLRALPESLSVLWISEVCWRS